MNRQQIPGDFKFSKKKGQCILTDERVVARQIDYANIKKTDTILEIGPGLGALTFKLADRALKILAIEQDEQFYKYLRGRIPKNVELVLGDALKLDLPRFDVCVSNLPYGISSPVTFKLLEHDFRVAILMYQKEFAHRMVAKSGEPAYSRLSVSVYYRAQCEILEHVPKTAFYPQPGVDSAIVRLAPRTPPFTLENEEFFFRVVNELFTKRRKKIKNSISRFVEGELRRREKFTVPLHKRIIKDVLFADLRVEMLAPKQIAHLSDNLYRLLSYENKKAPSGKFR